MSAPKDTEPQPISVDTGASGDDMAASTTEALVLESLELIRKQKEELARLRTKRTQVISPSSAAETGSHTEPAPLESPLSTASVVVSPGNAPQLELPVMTLPKSFMDLNPSIDVVRDLEQEVQRAVQATVEQQYAIWQRSEATKTALVQRLEQEVEAAVALVSNERKRHEETVVSLQNALQDALRQIESIKMGHMDAMLEATKQLRDMSAHCDELRELRAMEASEASRHIDMLNAQLASVTQELAQRDAVISTLKAQHVSAPPTVFHEVMPASPLPVSSQENVLPTPPSLQQMEAIFQAATATAARSPPQPMPQPAPGDAWYIRGLVAALSSTGSLLPFDADAIDAFNEHQLDELDEERANDSMPCELPDYDSCDPQAVALHGGSHHSPPSLPTLPPDAVPDTTTVSSSDTESATASVTASNESSSRTEVGGNSTDATQSTLDSDGDEYHRDARLLVPPRDLRRVTSGSIDSDAAAGGSTSPPHRRKKKKKHSSKHVRQIPVIEAEAKEGNSEDEQLQAALTLSAAEVPRTVSRTRSPDSLHHVASPPRSVIALPAPVVQLPQPCVAMDIVSVAAVSVAEAEPPSPHLLAATVAETHSRLLFVSNSKGQPSHHRKVSVRSQTGAASAHRPHSRQVSSVEPIPSHKLPLTVSLGSGVTRPTAASVAKRKDANGTAPVGAVKPSRRRKSSSKLRERSLSAPHRAGSVHGVDGLDKANAKQPKPTPTRQSRKPNGVLPVKSRPSAPGHVSVVMDAVVKPFERDDFDDCTDIEGVGLPPPSDDETPVYGGAGDIKAKLEVVKVPDYNAMLAEYAAFASGSHGVDALTGYGVPLTLTGLRAATANGGSDSSQKRSRTPTSRRPVTSKFRSNEPVWK